MSTVPEFKSPYLSQEEAAMFINKAQSTFRAYARKFRIPKKGPYRDRYHVDDLKLFMDNAFCFIIPPRDQPRSKAPFRPVDI